jgi:hypothetical protein
MLCGEYSQHFPWKRYEYTASSFVWRHLHVGCVMPFEKRVVKLQREHVCVKWSTVFTRVICAPAYFAYPNF